MKNCKSLGCDLLKAVFLASCCLATLACSSVVGVGGGGDSLTSISVESQSQKRVGDAIKEVFTEDGFSLVTESPDEFYFRRRGGRASQLTFGSLLSEGVYIEPEISVNRQSQNRYLLKCNVFIKEHSGHELLDADRQLHTTGKFAYKGLLNKVKKRVEAN